MSDEHDGVILGTRRPYKEMTDGTLRVQIDVDPEDKSKFLTLWPDTGDVVVMARLNPEHTRRVQMDRILRKNPPPKPPPALDDLRAHGTDKQFLEWLKTQPCAVGSGCEGDVVPAHVRRIANGAGTGIKPEYSAIALCNHHHQLQHQHGESRIGGKAWVDARLIDARGDWLLT